MRTVSVRERISSLVDEMNYLSYWMIRGSWEEVRWCWVWEGMQVGHRG